MRRIWIIAKKDWHEMIRNRTLVFMSTLIPALFVVIPFVLMLGLGSIQGGQAFQDPKFDQIIRALQNRSPELAALDMKTVIQIHVFRQFLLFLLLIPAMGGMTNATYSIIGEKQNRSLEPLLATPITVTELLLGKSLASAGPAILAGWAAAGLYGAGLRGLMGPVVFSHVMNGVAVLIIFLIAPLMGILSLSVGVCISSRSNDPRSAQQLGVFLVLPVVGWMVGQFTGLFFLTAPAILIIAAGLAGVNVVILGIGISLFQRETILTRWK